MEAAGEHAGLIPVVKTVQRGGKSHRQTYWVRAKEIRTRIRAVGGGKGAGSLDRRFAEEERRHKQISTMGRITVTREDIRLAGEGFSE